MNIERILGYHDYYKRVYLKSKIQQVFKDYLQRIFEDDVLNKLISRNLRQVEISPTFMCLGFFPKYLEYKEMDSRWFVDYTYFIDSKGFQKKCIKKEILRKIFLLIFEDFLKNRNYGIDFNAQYRIPLNGIQFTLEYQNSGKLYRDFFDSVEK
jgi:hypothetical protein